MQKLKNDKFNDIAHIGALIGVFKRDVETNLSADEIKSLGWAFKDANIADLSHADMIPYVDTKAAPDGGEVVIPDQSVKAKLVGDLLGAYGNVKPPAPERAGRDQAGDGAPGGRERERRARFGRHGGCPPPKGRLRDRLGRQRRRVQLRGDPDPPGGQDSLGRRAGAARPGRRRCGGDPGDRHHPRPAPGRDRDRRQGLPPGSRVRSSARPRPPRRSITEVGSPQANPSRSAFGRAAAGLAILVVLVAGGYAGRRLWLKSDDLLRPVLVARGDDAAGLVRPPSARGCEPCWRGACRPARARRPG